MKRWSLLVVGLMACGGAGAPAPQTGADATDGGADPCASFGQQLCAELGEDSDTCRSLRGVLVFMPPQSCQVALADVDHVRARMNELRGDCTKVADQLCRDTGEDSDTCKSARSDLPDVPPGHCQALLANYSAVLQSLLQREAMKKPLDPGQREAISAGDGPAFGPADATVLLVEFSDFECPFCAQAAEAVAQVKEKYADRVRFVFRQYPLPFHRNAQLSAQASLAAHKQGKFWQFHDLLFENQRALSREDLEKYATAIGLDMEAFKKDLDDAATVASVRADMELGEGVNVQGTPTLFINGRRADNPLDFDAVSAEIEEALSGK